MTNYAGVSTSGDYAVGVGFDHPNRLLPQTLEQRRDRYRSPKLQATVTITLPRFSGLPARRMAAATLAAGADAAQNPFLPASRRAQVNASSLVTVSTPLKATCRGSSE